MHFAHVALALRDAASALHADCVVGALRAGALVGGPGLVVVCGSATWNQHASTAPRARWAFGALLGALQPFAAAIGAGRARCGRRAARRAPV
eukprot:scaffold30649_cov92-Phaeocystis_antarctica.AAC.2